jgi:hypothetical protein
LYGNSTGNASKQASRPLVVLLVWFVSLALVSRKKFKGKVQVTKQSTQVKRAIVNERNFAKM